MRGKRNMLSDSEVASFCQKIGMIIKAGLPAYYDISILRDEAGDEKTKELLTQISWKRYWILLLSIITGKPIFMQVSSMQLLIRLFYPS